MIVYSHELLAALLLWGITVFILVYTEFVIDFKHRWYFLQVAMKEKMLTKLERDRAVGQVSFVTVNSKELFRPKQYICLYM